MNDAVKESYRAHITATEPLGPGIVQVTIAFDREFAFAPGQYVSVQFGEGVSRAYCIASAPQRPQAVQLCVRLGGGAGSGAVQELKVGERLTVDGPYGEFIIPEGDQRPVVLIAGDTGIAPVRSIVLHLKAVDDPRPITVLYEPAGAGAVYGADFKNLGESGAIRYLRGKVEDLIEGNRAALDGSLIMVTGFDPFLDRALSALERAGVGRDRVISESFGKLG